MNLRVIILLLQCSFIANSVDGREEKKILKAKDAEKVGPKSGNKKNKEPLEKMEIDKNKNDISQELRQIVKLAKIDQRNKEFNEMNDGKLSSPRNSSTLLKSNFPSFILLGAQRVRYQHFGSDVKLMLKASSVRHPNVPSAFVNTSWYLHQKVFDDFFTV